MKTFLINALNLLTYVFRLQRIRHRTQQNAIQSEHAAAITEVNPEFLAALPPNIQEEVLAQQRLEQQRQVAAQTNPNDPVDAEAFFQNLTPSLRQAILTDMEESQISVLPPNLIAEAQNLRRDWETRNRQIMQEQISHIAAAAAASSGSGPLSTTLTPSTTSSTTTTTMSANFISGGGSSSIALPRRYYSRSRFPDPTFSAQNLQRMYWGGMNIGGSNSAGIGMYISGGGNNSNNNNNNNITGTGAGGNSNSNSNIIGNGGVNIDGGNNNLFTFGIGTNNDSDTIIGGTTIMSSYEKQLRPLLDHESLTCLLLLLFIDEPKFNSLRLHRVIRILCYHISTRNWIIKTLLSIITRCNWTIDGIPPSSTLNKSDNNISDNNNDSYDTVTRPNWLNIRLDAALGIRNNVFILKRLKKSSKSSLSSAIDSNHFHVGIHKKATELVCRHALDLLISLAKCFPANFLPQLKQQQQQSDQGGAANNASTKHQRPLFQQSNCNNYSNYGINLIDHIMSKDKKKPIQETYTAPKPHANDNATDFWDILIRLENSYKSRQIDLNGNLYMHGRQRDFIDYDNNEFIQSPFATLINMLSYGLIKNSTQLTDKLLRLLSFISIGFRFLDEPITTGGRNRTTLNNNNSSNDNNNNNDDNDDDDDDDNDDDDDDDGNNNNDDNDNADNNGENENNVTNDPSSSPSPSTSHAVRAAAAGAASTSSNSPDFEANPNFYLTLPESEEHLRLAVNVLTSKSCSEDGLEDATSLLLNLSQCSNSTRSMIIYFLMDGALILSNIIREQVNDLLNELYAINDNNDSTAQKQLYHFASTSSAPSIDMHQHQTYNEQSTSSSTKGKLVYIIAFILELNYIYLIFCQSCLTQDDL